MLSMLSVTAVVSDDITIQYITKVKRYVFCGNQASCHVNTEPIKVEICKHHHQQQQQH